MSIRTRLQALESKAGSSGTLRHLYQQALTGGIRDKAHYLYESKHAAGHHDKRIEVMRLLAGQLPD